MVILQILKPDHSVLEVRKVDVLRVHQTGKIEFFNMRGENIYGQGWIAPPEGGMVVIT